MADNAALVAENSELKSQIKVEREQVAELIIAFERYKQSSDEEIALLREINTKLEAEVNLLQKQVKSERRKGKFKGFLGIIAGVGIGLLF